MHGKKEFKLLLIIDELQLIKVKEKKIQYILNCRPSKRNFIIQAIIY